MPSSIVTSFAKRSGKPEDEVEELWKKAKEQVAKDFPEVEKDSDRFFKIVTGLLKKMLKLEQAILPTTTTADIATFAQKVGPLFRRFPKPKKCPTGKTWDFAQKNNQCANISK